MGFFDGLRQGRDNEIEARKAVVRAHQAECRVHGRRYPGCPLDMIEREALVTRQELTALPERIGQTTDTRRRHE